MAVNSGARTSRTVVHLARPTLRRPSAGWRPVPRCATAWNASCAAGRAR